MQWRFQSRDVTDEDLIDQIGFVYQITHIKTGKSYIGKKLLKKKISRPPLKGKKRRRRSVVESDWQTYYGSNDELKADVKRLGEDQFIREILRFCKRKGELNYWEAFYQFEKGVLFDPKQWYNSWISVKCHRSTLVDFPAKKK